MSYRFPYISSEVSGTTVGKPLMPVRLTRKAFSLEHLALLDTGSEANVLPYSMGVQLGGNWEQQPVMPPLGGAFGSIETRGLLAHLVLEETSLILLAFLWAKTDNIPLIFGQINFFDVCNVCFFRADGYFEVTPRG